MKALCVVALALLVGCVETGREPASKKTVDGDAAILPHVRGTSKVTRIYDRETGVTCYVSDGYKAGGISCLQLEPKS